MPVSRKTDIERPLPYFGIFKPVLHIDDIEKYEARDLGSKGRNDLLKELMKDVWHDGKENVAIWKVFPERMNDRLYSSLVAGFCKATWIGFILTVYFQHSL